MWADAVRFGPGRRPDSAYACDCDRLRTATPTFAHPDAEPYTYAAEPTVTDTHENSTPTFTVTPHARGSWDAFANLHNGHSYAHSDAYPHSDPTPRSRGHLPDAHSTRTITPSAHPHPHRNPDAHSYPYTHPHANRDADRFRPHACLSTDQSLFRTQIPL
jgi:hypothetical protein